MFRQHMQTTLSIIRIKSNSMSFHVFCISSIKNKTQVKYKNIIDKVLSNDSLTTVRAKILKIKFDDFSTILINIDQCD